MGEGLAGGRPRAGGRRPTGRLGGSRGHALVSRGRQAAGNHAWLCPPPGREAPAQDPPPSLRPQPLPWGLEQTAPPGVSSPPLQVRQSGRSPRPPGNPAVGSSPWGPRRARLAACPLLDFADQAAPVSHAPARGTAVFDRKAGRGRPHPTAQGSGHLLLTQAPWSRGAAVPQGPGGPRTPPSVSHGPHAPGLALPLVRPRSLPHRALLHTSV